MNTNPPQSHFLKFLSTHTVIPFLVSFIVSAGFVPQLSADIKADRLKASGSRQVEAGGNILGQPLKGKAASAPLKDFRNHATIGKELAGPTAFATGIDSGAQWSRWNQRPVDSTYDSLAGFKQIAHTPAFRARDLKEISAAPEDDAVLLDQKMTTLVEDILGNVRVVEQKADVLSAATANGMMQAVDNTYQVTDKVYQDINGMYQEIGGLRTALDNNYEKFAQHDDPGPEIIQQFNAASDAMAGRVGEMIRAIDAMANKITADMQKSGGMVTSLDHMEKDGVAAVQYSDVLQVRIDEAARQYKLIDTALREKAGILVHPSGDVAGFFREQQDYLKSLKKYIHSDEISQLGGVRKYITDGQSYQQKVLADLQLTKLNLQKEEEYFRQAKVGAAQSRDIEVAPAEGENVCAQSEVKGLSSLKECAKSCRRVCRWKEKVGGNDCYECPSGSPDSCFDVGGLPANHPWCEPGGICHSDPMMYCSPYGAVGPQGEKLQCTNCKQRPDLCWQKVGGGMTWTNCKMGCWNGKCVFKGKYQEFEWDGSPEWIHCFECKTPPPPPTCEELGWGFDWKSDCEKTCPAPGYCEEVTMPSGKPKAPQPPKAPDEDGKPAEGQQDGGGEQDGGQSGGGTGTGSDSGGEGESGPGGGGKANPPTDGTAEQPGGGGEIAGGQGQQPITDGPVEPEGQGDPKKPDNPGTTAPAQPEKPKTDKPDITDGNPPPAPDNSQIRWLRTRIAQTMERIKDREEIVNDPREGDYVKTSAASQLDAYNKELERLKKELKEQEEKELERQRKAAEEKARSEEAARERDRTRTRWPDPKVEMQKIRLKELKESIDALKKRAEEIRDALAGRKEHLDRLTREIDLLEREIAHHKETAERDSDHATRAKETIPDLEKKLAHKKNLRNALTQAMQEAQKQYAEELEALKRTYQKKLYAADENARRQEETKRIDEYYDLFMELEHTKASREERNRAFEEKFKDMESQIAAAKANGDDDTAEKLQEQLDNMKRGKEAWDKQYESQIKNLEDRLFETGHHRNFDDGVGPINKEGLIDKLNEYGKIMDNEIAATEKKISQLQSGSTMTKEQSQQLEALKGRLAQLRAGREGITEKQNVLKNGYKLPEDIAANIQNSTNRFAEGSKNQGPDKSFARLFAESLAEEAVHNLNPLVAAKKSVAFGWGVAKGVGSAVKGLAELGVGAVDLTMEVYLTNLGFDIETDALDALNNMISTIGSNANFDGVIKAVVAAGGAIDAKLKKLEKSGDIDWATAEAGGEVAGEFVVADAVIAGTLGKASKIISGADEVSDAAKLAGKIDEAKVAGKIDDATDIGRTATKAADDAPTGSAATKVDDAPTPKPHETPPARAPPPEPRPYNNKNPLPTNTRTPTQLGDDVLEGIEKNQGFRKDHAQRMNEFAQEHDAFLLVRDGNPDSVKFFDDPDLMPKPMSSKAKTAKVGPNQGLVVDPTHPKQAQYWDDAIAEAKKTDPAHAAWLEKQRGKALDSWRDYGDYMKDHGYRVNPDSGVIEYVEKLPDGTDKVWKGVHGDYDLHGVYRKAPDGTMESVSFGSGQKFGPNGLDVEGGALRQQLNDKLSGGKKDFIQHGGQDDWVPDPKKIPNKPPDPPVTVFFPDGRPPVRLGDAKAMKAFYEGEMGVKWPYPEPR